MSKPKKKPAKPRPDFPLTPHSNGTWCKRIRKKLHYFGRWGDPDAALVEYLDQKDDLYAGRVPRRSKDALDLAYALDHFLSSKKVDLVEGRIRPRTFWELDRICERIAEYFGEGRLLNDIRPEDLTSLRLELGRGWKKKSSPNNGHVKVKERLSPTTIKGELTRARMVFLHVNEYLATTPIAYKKALRPPSRPQLRQIVNERGPADFSAKQIKVLADAASVHLRAMIYLGINCGFGNADCAKLRGAQLDLDGCWHDFWRPKTQNPRRCPLWPETIHALRESIAERPKPKSSEVAEYVFLTREGNCWMKENGWNAISTEFRKLLVNQDYYRKGVTGFYGLRRTLETVGTDAGHQVALDFMMGHCPEEDDMPARYRQRISDESLLKVSNFMREWFLAGQKTS